MQADLRMSCYGVRKEIVDTVKMFYATKTRENLPIYGVRQKNLGMYTTSESDTAKGISRIPLSLARLDEEDLVDIQQLTIRRSECFNLPEVDDMDLLNKAFSCLGLQKGDYSPEREHDDKTYEPTMESTPKFSDVLENLPSADYDRGSS